MDSKNRVTILAGATGSGKSTQIAQYLLEAGVITKRVTITQPRRVAALSLAQRVASEVGCAVGSTVGYTVRFDESTSHRTKIRYATDGILLREALIDRLFSKDNVLFVDEAHERSINTDVLLGLLKSALHSSTSLRVVVMSATLDAMVFAKFFDTPNLFLIQGRQYPIQHFFTSVPEKNYLDGVITSCLYIHSSKPQGGILVFLPGEREIQSCLAALTSHLAKFGLLHEASGERHGDENRALVSEHCRQKVAGYSSAEVLPLYASLTTTEQMHIFTQTPVGVRRIILATNIAETSITVPNIKYVIDSGFARQKAFNSQTRLSSLMTVPCSQASILQRSGRVGRDSPGEVYHLYPYSNFMDLPANDVPEILRESLTSIFLQLIGCGVTNPLQFDFLSQPSYENKRQAIDTLVRIGALEDTADESVKAGCPVIRLSVLGRNIVRFPVEPELAACILRAMSFGDECLRAVIALVSMLSCDTIFVTPSDNSKRDMAGLLRRQFYSATGDHMMLYNVWRAFVSEAPEEQKRWCGKFFISYKNMCYAQRICDQLMSIAADVASSAHSLSAESEDSNGSSLEEGILRSFCAGFFFNVAKLSRDERTYESKGGECKVHPSSSLRALPPCVLYMDIIKTTAVYMRTVSEISEAWL